MILHLSCFNLLCFHQSPTPGKSPPCNLWTVPIYGVWFERADVNNSPFSRPLKHGVPDWSCACRLGKYTVSPLSSSLEQNKKLSHAVRTQPHYTEKKNCPWFCFNKSSNAAEKDMPRFPKHEATQIQQ